MHNLPPEGITFVSSYSFHADHTREVIIFNVLVVVSGKAGTGKIPGEISGLLGGVNS
ncbi:MAG: hypothetical protein IT266_09280 [Saprospiraceae bacterium]|nr:hypothetical protein [Saprospiraceae bacterium]